MPEELQRDIYIIGDIKEDMIENIISQIVKLNMEDDKNELSMRNYIRKDINIYISSYGGSVHDGLAIYEIINNSKTNVITHNLGKCMSMGAIIFLAGNKRVMYKNSTFLLHQITSVHRGTLTNLEASLVELQNLQKILNNIIIEKTIIDIDLLNKNIDNKDWILTYDDCLKYGVIN